jgi:tellurite resistance-related uncharacterized protein
MLVDFCKKKKSVAEMLLQSHANFAGAYTQLCTYHGNNVMETRASMATGLPHQIHNANENIHSLSTTLCN